jgi:hypothetical protein
MTDRAAPIIPISIAPFYKGRISSAYALSDFDSTIMLCEHRQMHLTNKQQMQFIAIDLLDADTSKIIFGTQKSALGG